MSAKRRLRAAYDEERERFQTAEERRVRHILIEVADGEEDAARTKAEGVATAAAQRRRLRRTSRARFSTDAGTKAQGGDLGWIGRGMLVGPFEDALFAMQVGERQRSRAQRLRFPRDSSRRGARRRLQPFEAVRDELAAETAHAACREQQFYDRANELGDEAFDAYNELATRRDRRRSCRSRR